MKKTITTRKTLSSMDEKGYWNKRKGKEIVRNFFTSMKKKCNVYFSFPGVDCADIKKAIEKGVINKDTLIIVIERNKKTARSIKKYLSSLPNLFYIHIGELSRFNNLGEVLNGKEIDLAFFDYCGPMIESDVRWAIDNYKFFSDNCKIGYTISTHIRRREYIDRMTPFFKKKNNISIFKYCRYTSDNTPIVFCGESRENYLDKSRYGVRERKGIYLDVAQYILALMFGVECSFETVFEYKDTIHGMAVFMFSLNKKGKNINQYLNKFINYMDKFCPKIKKHTKKIKKVNIHEQERKEIVKALISEGTKNKGKVIMTVGLKARLTRLNNMLNKNAVMQIAGIKAGIVKKSGYTGKIITVNSIGKVISVM